MMRHYLGKDQARNILPPPNSSQPARPEALQLEQLFFGQTPNKSSPHSTTQPHEFKRRRLEHIPPGNKEENEDDEEVCFSFESNRCFEPLPSQTARYLRVAMPTPKSIDASLSLSYSIERYMRNYRKNFFYITPVHPAALDPILVRRVTVGGSELPYTDAALTMNVFVALALGAKQCGEINVAFEFLAKARLLAGELFDESSYSAAAGMFALAFALMGEGEHERGTYLITLASAICKSIGAENSYVYLRTLYFTSLLPGLTPEERTQLVDKCNKAHAEPSYIDERFVSLLPLPKSGLLHLNAVTKAFMSMFVLLTLDTELCTADNPQTELKLHMRKILKSLGENLVNGPAFKNAGISKKVLLLINMSLQGLQAEVARRLGLHNEALFWAQEFMKGTFHRHYKYNATSGMLPFLQIVSNILIQAKDYHSVLSLLKNSEHMVSIDRSVAAFNGETLALLQQMAEAPPQYTQEQQPDTAVHRALAAPRPVGRVPAHIEELDEDTQSHLYHSMSENKPSPHQQPQPLPQLQQQEQQRRSMKRPRELTEAERLVELRKAELEAEEWNTVREWPVHAPEHLETHRVAGNDDEKEPSVPRSQQAQQTRPTPQPQLAQHSHHPQPPPSRIQRTVHEPPNTTTTSTSTRLRGSLELVECDEEEEEEVVVVEPPRPPLARLYNLPTEEVKVSKEVLERLQSFPLLKKPEGEQQQQQQQGDQQQQHQQQEGGGQGGAQAGNVKSKFHWYTWETAKQGGGIFNREKVMSKGEQVFRFN